MYVDLKTGERTDVHPCDEYYKQLLIQERRKRGNKGGLQKGPPGGQLSYAKSMVMQQQMMQSAQPKPIVVDPLVKMQQEK